MLCHCAAPFVRAGQLGMGMEEVERTPSLLEALR